MLTDINTTMKKTRLDFFNLFLLLLAVGITILYLASKVKNREYEKVFWSGKITVSASKQNLEHDSAIKVIEAKYYNTFDKSKRMLHSDSRVLLNSKSNDSIYFKSEHGLLPDSLHLKYFSIEDRKFYELNTNIPYNKIKKAAKASYGRLSIDVEIKSKGNVILSVNSKNLIPEKTSVFQAQETTGNLSELLFVTRQKTRYNDYDGITNVKDFADLMGNKYNWVFKTELEPGDQISSAYAYSFLNEKIYDIEEDQILGKLSIPERFYIYWTNGNKYDTVYYFNPIEILSTFRKLNHIDGEEPILLTFKLYKDKYAECVLSKNGISIPVRNVYPKIP